MLMVSMLDVGDLDDVRERVRRSGTDEGCKRSLGKPFAGASRKIN